MAVKLGLEKVIMKHGKLVGYFISNQESDFYKSEVFTKVLQFVQMHPNTCKMKEKQTRKGLRLLLTFESISTSKKSIDCITTCFGLIIVNFEI